MTPPRRKTDVPQGTLDLLILKTLWLELMQGLGISRRLEQIRGGLFQVNSGSLFPALHHMEPEGWIRGEWGRSENNRRAKYYRLTRAGKNKLRQQERDWRRTVCAIATVLETT